MKNPTLVSADGLTPGGKPSDIDFRVFKAFDQKTGAEVAAFKRSNADVWQWKNVGQYDNYSFCPDAIAVQLETLYQAYLAKQIVE